MAKYKSIGLKTRLAKQRKRTKWAPYWTVLKVFGKGKRIHPSRLTRVKRHWRRNKLKTSIKANQITKPRIKKVLRKY